jgi:hypothetical protein
VLCDLSNCLGEKIACVVESCSYRFLLHAKFLVEDKRMRFIAPLIAAFVISGCSKNDGTTTTTTTTTTPVPANNQPAK